MQGKVWKVLTAGGIALLAGLAGSPAAGASVAPAHHAGPAGVKLTWPHSGPAHSATGSRTRVRPDGIGVGGGLAPGVQSAQVYQCPETFCNQGTDYAGNNIAAICVYNDSEGWWTLTLDHADNVVGFIPANGDYRASVPPPLCPSYNDLATATGAFTVYQCPESFCNQGTDYTGNTIGLYCNAYQGDSGWWLLTLDLQDYVVGFISGTDSNVGTC